MGNTITNSITEKTITVSISCDTLNRGTLYREGWNPSNSFNFSDCWKGGFGFEIGRTYEHAKGLYRYAVTITERGINCLTHRHEARATMAAVPVWYVVAIDEDDQPFEQLSGPRTSYEDANKYRRYLQMKNKKKCLRVIKEIDPTFAMEEATR